MGKLLAGILCAGMAHAITIIGPSGIGNTKAEILIPSDLLSTVPLGGTYKDAATDLYDQTFTYTVTGGTGTGYMFFTANGFATKFDFGPGIEVMASVAWFILPFQLITPPNDNGQGGTPFTCGGGVGIYECTIPFEFGVPKTLRWRVRSTVGYLFSRDGPMAIPRLRGANILSSTTLDLWGVGQYSEATGWTVIDNATVTITPSGGVPEPGAFLLMGTGLGAAVVGGRIRGWLPAARPR